MQISSFEKNYMDTAMNIKIIYSDLDGTLLFDAGTITDKTDKVLRMAASKGILFVPATGRHYRCIPECIRSLPGLRYEISSNGALIRDIMTENIIFAAYFEKEVLQYLLDITEETGKPFEIFQRDRIIMNEQSYEYLKLTSDSRPYILKCFGDSVLVPDIEASLATDPYGIHKFLIRGLSQSLYHVLFEKINASGLAEAASSLYGNMEISPAKINKGKALLCLCDYLGVSPDETAAFGDGTNDISMLNAAGVSVAVMNASDEVKEHADFVAADNCHDGPALFIENYLL